MAIERFSFSPAVREEINLLVGLSGPTGSGKSLTALRLAAGIQQVCPGPICLIDTENGRAGLYAPKAGDPAAPPRTFDFLRLDLGPPFTPARYEGAVKAASLLGPSVLIIDQMTAEWTGPGGILDYVGQEQAKPGNKYAAWNKPKRAHTSLMGILEHFQGHIIVCLRAREKTALSGNNVIDLGWRAIAETELPYQFTFHFLVGHTGAGTLTADRTVFDQAKTYDGAEGIVPEGCVGTEAIGAELARWAKGANT